MNPENFNRSYIKKVFRILLFIVVLLSGTQMLPTRCHTDTLLDRFASEPGILWHMHSGFNKDK